MKKRAEEHFSDRIEITKHRRPLELVYYEAFLDEETARKQEIFYKTSQGRRILEKRLYFLK